MLLLFTAIGQGFPEEVSVNIYIYICKCVWGGGLVRKTARVVWTQARMIEAQYKHERPLGDEIVCE